VVSYYTASQPRRPPPDTSLIFILNCISTPVHHVWENINLQEHNTKHWLHMPYKTIGKYGGFSMQLIRNRNVVELNDTDQKRQTYVNMVWM
jgi:hypothetical protein